MIKVKNLSIERGGKAILDAIDATFDVGQLTVILGPNGAGKSTLLKAISGAFKPDRGRVILDDLPLSKFSSESLAKRRGVLAQESLLQFDFSVEEVVLLGRIPHLSGWESQSDYAICQEALRTVDMLAMAQRRFPTLSGGEKQRVNLARVLAQLEDDRSLPNDAGLSKWILLDEPTSALDLRHQHSTLENVCQLVKQRNFGTIAVLHDLNLAMRYADKIVLLHQGKHMASGTPQEVLKPEIISCVYGVRAEIHCPSNQSCPFIQIASLLN